MPLLRFTILLSACCFLYACTPDQRSSGRQAEMAYVDLFYALQTKDTQTAKVAAQELDQSLAELRATWQRPYAEERLEDIRYHLDQAAWVYADARSSIQAGDLDLAAIQLDRATYELTAASPAAVRELYIGTIYDFLVAWIEVSHIVGEPDLCAMEWPDFSHYAKDARNAWRRVRNVRPNDRMYGAEAPIDEEAFQSAKNEVETTLNLFLESLKDEDQCASAQVAEKVEEAIWGLVLLFGKNHYPGML